MSHTSCVITVVTRLLASALLALPVMLLADTQGNCSKAFYSAMDPGRQISMDLRSGDVEIVGSKAPSIAVTCRVDDGYHTDSVRISLAAGHLRVYGGPNNNVHIRIEVPEKTNLLVRSTAGNVTMTGVTGDKDVELNAGNLTILVGAPEDYRVAEGSVLAGNLNARVFGTVKDGLFRSFRKESSGGKYRLRAKILAGNLNLK